MAKKPAPKRMRGYDYGGQVLSTDSFGRSVSEGFNMGMGGAKAYKEAGKPDTPKPTDTKSENTSVPKQPSVTVDYMKSPAGGVPTIGGNARGGVIKKVAGKPIGKDDGLIPAQRGEWVIRKSAVKKLGNKVLGQINKGKLPSRRGR
jgi:hypothetical protein